MVTVEFDRLTVKPGFKILDIGCGSGRHTCAAYQCRQVTAIGVDLDFDDLKEARSRLQLHDRLGEHGGGIWALSTADVLSLPFKDSYFDLVICSEVLEHILSHRKAIREIVRVLQPGRDLVVSVPRYWPERICWLLSPEYAGSNGGHVRIFKQKQLISDLTSAGLRMWARHFAHSLHAPFWWLKCLVGPDRTDSSAVDLYHRFLTWDMMKKPRVTGWLDKLLNPVLGKSLVMYFRKEM
ncbi:MAG: methyltransferase domain-containing protein [Deltaproteobacteria bacterium]|jgi:SAM-dependent methyltransferase|nr:methyltransferase domain-containing protein [Deltaproteobacteria bacterium]